MLRVSAAYSTWAAQLFTPLTSSEVLRKCRDWSGKLMVKNVMGTLRERELLRETEPLTEKAYGELTEGARRAAEADAARRKEKAAQRGVALEGGSVASNREGDEYEVEEGEEEEEVDFIERQRRARGGREEEEDEVEALRSGWGAGGGAGGGGGSGGGGGGTRAGDSQESFGAEEFGDYIEPRGGGGSGGAAVVELEDSEDEGGGGGAGAAAAAAAAAAVAAAAASAPAPRRRAAEIEEDDF